METDEFPTAEKLHDLIFQAIEIEGMESDFLWKHWWKKTMSIIAAMNV